MYEIRVSLRIFEKKEINTRKGKKVIYTPWMIKIKVEK